MKLESINRKKMGSSTNTWKVNMFINNQWVKEEITREIRRYFEMND